MPGIQVWALKQAAGQALTMESSQTMVRSASGQPADSLFGANKSDMPSGDMPQSVTIASEADQHACKAYKSGPLMQAAGSALITVSSYTMVRSAVVGSDLALGFPFISNLSRPSATRGTTAVRLLPRQHARQTDCASRTTTPCSSETSHKSIAVLPVLGYQGAESIQGCLTLVCMFTTAPS